MFIQREEDGIWLRELPMWVVDTLLCLPEWVESENPDVRARLLPMAYEDEDRDKEWRAALGESLEHLFARRTEIVKKDLHKLQIVAPEGEPDEPDADRPGAQVLFHVWIPAPHLSAWISTLQAGTHAVFILEGLTAEDVKREEEGLASPDMDPARQVALIRLSILQQILVGLLGE